MHPNEQRITDFYTAFASKNPGPMRAAYAPDAEFSDPAFPHLKGAAVGDMWAMLCEQAKDFRLEFRDVKADELVPASLRIELERRLDEVAIDLAELA